jgi:arylformamidase
MTDRRRFVGGAAALAAIGAQAQAVPAKPRTVRYAERPGANANLTSLDLYAPPQAQARPAPLVAFIHGGGWRIGDKTNPGAGADKAAFFARRGFAFASLNYRLSPDVAHPAHVEDVAAGLAWLIDNAAAQGCDPGRIFLMGHSAGAHLAALVAADERRLGAFGHRLSALRGVVLLDGAGYDVAAQMRALGGVDTILSDMYRAAFGDDPTRWADASPVRFVASGKGIAPFLIVHTDRRAAVRQSLALASALRAASVEARVFRASGLSHAEVNRGIGRPGDRVGPQVLSALAAWGA